ncbi:MAG TPA: DNA gyrase inhibitor YacG [Dongiaceae bacterium]
MCRAPAVQKYRPFCSKRCADVDLGRWIGGDYRIAGNPANALNQEDNNGEDQD